MIDLEELRKSIYHPLPSANVENIEAIIAVAERLDRIAEALEKMIPLHKRGDFGPP